MALRLCSIILCLFFMSINAHAAWKKRNDVVNGAFGAGELEFGFSQVDHSYVLPALVSILPKNRLLINDWENDRILVYGHSNELIETVYWEPINDENSIYANRLPKYTLAKIRRYMSDGSYWIKTSKGGKRYNAQNEIVSTYEGRPPELGIIKHSQAIKGGGVEYVIEYEDFTYAITSPAVIDDDWDIDGGFTRDKNGFLYGYSIVQNSEDLNDGWHERVHKFDRCGRLIATLDLPEDNIEEIVHGDPAHGHVQFVYHEEYGPPVIGPDGSIYAYKRTPETYSILKWEWVDDPNDPQPGPDAPSELGVTPSTTGLYLTWQASPQDPGCVSHYEVERAGSADGSYSSIATIEAGTLNYSDEDASAGSSYFYKIRASAGGSYSDYTEVISGTRPQ